MLWRNFVSNFFFFYPCTIPGYQLWTRCRTDQRHGERWLKSHVSSRNLSSSSIFLGGGGGGGWVQIAKRNEPLPADMLTDPAAEDESTRRRNSCTVFLGYTSNMASCGVREAIRFLAQHRMVRKIERQIFLCDHIRFLYPKRLFLPSSLVNTL